MTSLPDPHVQAAFYDGVPMKRFAAWIVDTVLIVALTALAIPLTGFIGLFFLGGLALVIGFAYRVITLANGSATWGMRLMAMEFRTAQGTRFDLGTAFAHTLGYSLSVAITPLQIVSIVLMLTTARGQGLTDHALGTVALNRRALA